MNSIKEAEDFLLGKMSAEDQVVFSARILADPVLRLNVAAQKKIYRLLGFWRRKQLHSELNNIHHTLLHDREHIVFQKKIAEIFTEN